MRVIYRLPKYIAILICGIVVIDIYKSVKLANATSFYEIIKYSDNVQATNIEMFGFDLYTIFVIAGVILGMVLGIFRRELIKASIGTVLAIQILYAVQVLIGVKIDYGLEMVIANKGIEYFTITGQSLYGGIFLSLVFVPVLAKLFKMNVRKLYDFLAPYWLIEFICGKIACYTAGCCAARACSVFSAEIVLPIQLFEAICLLIILQIVFSIERKRIDGVNTRIKEGSYFFITMGIYGICRFLTEFIKDTPELYYGITINQVFSVISIVIAIIVFMKWNTEYEK